ncbi:MAG: helix-turn-helix domain-containing protein [Clostridia bacterium]|nr:helix-turn-helix domain-containing protein [Clostridia bacterium]
MSIDRTKSKNYPFLPEPTEKSVTYYVTSFGHEYLLPDYYMNRRNKDLFMVNYVVSGALSVTIDGKTRIMKKGDACFLNLMRHSVIFPVEENTEIYFFHCMGGDIKNVYGVFSKSDENIVGDIPEEKITEAFDFLAGSVEGDNDMYFRSGVIYRLLMDILSAVRSDKSVKYPELIKKIIYYVWQSFPIPAPRDIADKFGYSTIYLERLFKKNVGQSLGYYLLNKRYEQACQCLIDTDMTVGEVAYHVGYSTPQGLNVLFHKFGKLTPLAFRRRFGKK